MQSIYRTLLAQLGESAGTVLTFGGKAPVSVTPTPKTTTSRLALSHYDQLLKQYKQQTAELYRQKLRTAAANATSNLRDAETNEPSAVYTGNGDLPLKVIQLHTTNATSNQRDALPATPIKTAKASPAVSKVTKPKPTGERW